MTKWFGERLKKTREDHLGWTQGELSTLAGISQHQISYFENSQSMPTLENFKKLCITMDVTADYLLGIVNRPINPKHYMSKVTTTPDSKFFTSFDDLMAGLSPADAEVVVHAMFGIIEGRKIDRLRAKEENDV